MFTLCRSALTQQLCRICHIMTSKKDTAVGKEREDINQTALQAQSVRRGHLSPVSEQTQSPLAGGYDFLYLWRRRTVLSRSSELSLIHWLIPSLCQIQQHKKKQICLMKYTVEDVGVGVFSVDICRCQSWKWSYRIMKADLCQTARQQMQLWGNLSENQSCVCSQLLSDYANSSWLTGYLPFYSSLRKLLG